MEISRKRGVIMGDRNVHEVNGDENACVSVEIAHNLMPGGNRVLMTANAHQWPQQTAWLEPAAARLLARHLLELADEADLLNLESDDVEMACTTCGRPARRAFGTSSWVHQDPEGMLGCTASPVKVRVAAGV